MASIDTRSTTIITPQEQTAGDAKLTSSEKGIQITNSPGDRTYNSDPVLTSNGLMLGESRFAAPACSIREFNFSRTDPAEKFTTKVTTLPQYGTVDDSCLNLKVSRPDPVTQKPSVIAYNFSSQKNDGLTQVIRTTDATQPGTPSMLLKPITDEGIWGQQESIVGIARDGSIAMNAWEGEYLKRVTQTIRGAVWEKNAPVAEFLPLLRDQIGGKDFQYNVVLDMDAAGGTKALVGPSSHSSSGFASVPTLWTKRGNQVSYTATELPITPRRLFEAEATGVRVNEDGKIIVAGKGFGYIDGAFKDVPLLWIENSSGGFDLHELSNTGVTRNGEKFTVTSADLIQSGTYIERTRSGQKIPHHVTFVTGTGRLEGQQDTVPVVYQIGGKDAPVALTDILSLQKTLPPDTVHLNREFTIDGVNGEARAFFSGRSLPVAGGDSTAVYSDFSLENFSKYYDELASASLASTRQSPAQILSAARDQMRAAGNSPSYAPPQKAPSGWPKDTERSTRFETREAASGSLH